MGNLFFSLFTNPHHTVFQTNPTFFIHQFSANRHGIILCTKATAWLIIIMADEQPPPPPPPPDDSIRFVFWPIYIYLLFWYTFIVMGFHPFVAMFNMCVWLWTMMRRLNYPKIMYLFPFHSTFYVFSSFRSYKFSFTT